MAMTYEEELAEKARRLRLLESAAASAMYNGATVEEIMERVQIGIAEVRASVLYRGPLKPPGVAAEPELAPAPAAPGLERPAYHEPRHRAA